MAPCQDTIDLPTLLIFDMEELMCLFKPSFHSADVNLIFVPAKICLSCFDSKPICLHSCSLPLPSLLCHLLHSPQILFPSPPIWRRWEERRIEVLSTHLLSSLLSSPLLSSPPPSLPPSLISLSHILCDVPPSSLCSSPAVSSPVPSCPLLSRSVIPCHALPLRTR